MLENLSVAVKVLTAPVWLAWRAYQGLWWAFDDAPAAPKGMTPGKFDAGAASAPGASVQAGGVPDAKASPVFVPRPKPIKELKLGFVSSTILWFPAAYLAAWMHNMGWVSQTGALCGTLWTMALLWVVSLMAVRRNVRNTPVKRSPLEVARAAVQAVKDAPKNVAARAAGAARNFAGLPAFARTAFSKVRGAAEGMVPSKFRGPDTGSVNGQGGLKF